MSSVFAVSPEPELGRNLTYGLLDALGRAIVTGRYRFRNVQGRKALIILTDGEDTTSRLPYEEMLLDVRASRTPLYFIGIGLGFSDISGTSKMKALARA